MSETRSAILDDAQASAAPGLSAWTRWYAVILLTVINMFAFADRLALSILQEPIKVDLHLTDAELGLLSGLAFAIFHSTMGIPLARFADRAPRVKLMAICLSLWSLATTLAGMARNFPQLFLARMSVGVGEAGCVAPGHSLIADYFPRERRALPLAIFQCGSIAGLSLGLFVIGALGQHLGWRLSLQIAGFAGIPIALLMVFTLREPPRPQPSNATKEPALQALGALLRRPAFVHVALAAGLGMTCSTGMTQWFPSFLIRSFGMSIVQVGAWSGLAVAIGGLAGLLSGGMLTTWLARRDPRWELWIPAIAFSAGAPFSVLMVLSPTALLALIFKTVAIYLGSIGSGVAIIAVHSLSEPHRRATAIAITQFLASLLGLGVGPLLIGVMSDVLAPSLGRESLRYSMLISCVFLVWAIIHFLLAARRSTKDRVN